LDSVKNQSYENFEIIVVNDGSTDGSGEIVRSHKSKNLILIDQSNYGVSVARNTGVSSAKYDYIAFLDADDTWERDFLYELNMLVNNYPGAGIYGINHFYKYKNGKVTYEKYHFLFNGQSSGIIKDYFKIFASSGRSPFSNSGCCFPRKIFLETGGYKPGIRVTEDSDLWCRIALKYDVAFLTKPLLTYYLETPSNTRTIIEYKDFQISTTLQEFLDSDQIPEKYIKSVRHLISFQQVSLVKRAILTGNGKFALRKLLDMRLIKFYPFSAVCLFFIGLFPFKVFTSLSILVKRFR
jgi:glycosyltransferase involved in cell wall biosynthesis